jgi:hypothetical protein
MAMTPGLLGSGVREVLGIHRTDNRDTIEVTRRKGIPRVGTVIRYRALWKVWFDYVEAEEEGPGACEHHDPGLRQELGEPGV